MKLVKIFILMLYAVMLFSPTLAQDRKSPGVKKLLYSAYFKGIKSFELIEIVLSGSAEKIGLVKGELEDFLKLSFKDKFAGIKLSSYSFEERRAAIGWGFTKTSRVPKTDRERKKQQEGINLARKMGFLTCRVWTIGKNFPIAFHSKCRAGNFLVLDQGWEREYLGVGYKENVRDEIKKTLNETIESLANDFFKARGELK